MYVDLMLTWYVECVCRGYRSKEREKAASDDPKVCVHVEGKGGD